MKGAFHLRLFARNRETAQLLYCRTHQIERLRLGILDIVSGNSRFELMAAKCIRIYVLSDFVAVWKRAYAGRFEGLN
jgi:hypothetical protein